jgi:heme exporter protein A
LFEHLSLELQPGEALHVAGPNGTGKSSLLRLVAGLLSADTGQIHRAVPLALADEHLALDRELPLARALAFWAGDVDRAMEVMGLARLSAVPVRFLSSGQAKRATLARVIGSGARLWLLDEPLNALDGDGAERLSAAMSVHRANGGAILAASHVPLAGDWRRQEMGA